MIPREGAGWPKTFVFTVHLVYSEFEAYGHGGVCVRRPGNAENNRRADLEEERARENERARVGAKDRRRVKRTGILAWAIFQGVNNNG